MLRLAGSLMDPLDLLEWPISPSLPALVKSLRDWMYEYAVLFSQDCM